MTRKELVTLCLDDACNGEPQPLMGLLDYLILDCHVDPGRLVEIAKRQFSIPETVSWDALCDLHQTIIQ